MLGNAPEMCEKKKKKREKKNRERKKAGINRGCYFESGLFDFFNVTRMEYHQVFSIVENGIGRPDSHLPAGTEKL